MAEITDIEEKQKLGEADAEKRKQSELAEKSDMTVREFEDFEEAVEKGETLIPYTPRALCKSLSSCIPISLAGETNVAMSYFEKDKIDRI